MSPLRRRILRRSSRPHVADGDLIAGLDLRGSAAGSAAGVVPAGKLSKTGPPRQAALSRVDDAGRDALLAEHLNSAAAQASKQIGATERTAHWRVQLRRSPFLCVDYC